MNCRSSSSRKTRTLGRRTPARGIAGVQLAAKAGQRFVVVEDGLQAAAPDFRAGQVGGQDGQAVAGEHRIEDAIQVVETEAAGDRHVNLIAVATDQFQCAAHFGLQVAEAGVPGQFARMFRRAVGGEVSRCRTDHAAEGDQSFGDGIVGRGLGVAEGKVDVVVHQIDQLVGEDQFALQFRVLRR